MGGIVNIAAYRFAALDDLRTRRENLLRFCKERSLKGTILLSTEGINLFVAGTDASIRELLDVLRRIPGLETLEPKFSYTDDQPFTRMLVRIKREIIAFGVEGIEPARRTSPKLPARELKKWLDEGRKVTLLDTRNDYEVKLGTFRNALPIGIQHFRDFPSAVRKLPEEMKKEPIVMFCTGGIRCEKAGPFMEREGFQEIYQLDGGILKYFEECGGAHYDGECFVFDHRVGVDPALNETRSTQCFRCQSPLTEEEQNDSRYQPGVSCPYCIEQPEREMRASISRRHEILRSLAEPLPGSTPYLNFRPLSIPAEAEGLPLCDALAIIVRHLAREHWETECERGAILDNSRRPAAAGRIVHAGERYSHAFENIIEPEVNAAIEILHEDEALIVLNKPAPLPIHPGGRYNRNTLQFFLHAAYAPQKPRPAHRLDANTSGVLLVTRTRHFASRLQPQFEAGTVEKRYLVRVHGIPAEDTFFCDAPISSEPEQTGSRIVDFESGLDARTEFRVLARLGDSALLEARPCTGRTNQIRVHLWHLGFPVWNDPLYLPDGKLGAVQTLRPGEPAMALHAWSISFDHPLDGSRRTFTAPPPSWAAAFSASTSLLAEDGCCA